MFDSLHQTLLMDNGVANLLEQMNKINKDLGLLEVGQEVSISKSDHQSSYSEEDYSDSVNEI